MYVCVQNTTSGKTADKVLTNWEMQRAWAQFGFGETDNYLENTETGAGGASECVLSRDEACKTVKLNKA